MELPVSSRPWVGFGVFAQSSALNAGVTDSMVLPWLPGSAFWSTLPVVLVALGVGVTGFVLGVAVDEGDGEGVAASSPDGTRSPLPDFEADGDGLAFADADGEADADAEAVGAGAGEDGPAWMTWRKFSNAGWSSDGSGSRVGAGADPMIWLLPWVLIWGPPAPAGSTRWGMMPPACSRAPCVTFFPCKGVAVRIT